MSNQPLPTENHTRLCVVCYQQGVQRQATHVTVSGLALCTLLHANYTNAQAKTAVQNKPNLNPRVTANNTQRK